MGEGETPSSTIHSSLRFLKIDAFCCPGIEEIGDGKRKFPNLSRKAKIAVLSLHSLNSLFQQKDAFTRARLNAIAEELLLKDSNRETWTPLSIVLKPHHNVLTGNYDINVLIAALAEKGKNVVWHDRRNGASSIDIDAPEDILMGIVLNISVKRFVGLWRSRHWVTLRKIDGVWYNLDSDLTAPEPFKDVNQVREFLDSIIGQGGEVLLVMNDKKS